MQSKKPIVISVIIGVVIIGSAAAYAFGISRSTTQNRPASTVLQTVSKKELTEANGKSGHRCLVAVDGTVYEIKDNPQWSGGAHRPSAGRAYCGADMSKVIGQSPHGRSILDQLDKVGKLGS